MADQATALTLAELAVSQDDWSAMAVEEGRVAAGGSTSHVGKNEPSKMGWMVLLLQLLFGWTNKCMRSRRIEQSSK